MRGRGHLDPARVALLALAAALVVPAAAAPRPAAVPSSGVLAPGKSLGGIRLGDTKAAVTARWGARHRRCTVCRAETWLFTVRPGTHAGAAVSFRGGRATAIFTLGVPRGWRTSQGLRLGDPAVRIQDLYGRLPYTGCVGYGAVSIRRARVVSSFYTYGESVYGFALTRPSEPVCQ
jgi:hypothetical protein